MITYTDLGNVLRVVDDSGRILCIPKSAINPDYQRALTEVSEGMAEIVAADPDPGPGPTRDDRLMAAVGVAKIAVKKSGVFTVQQADVLSEVFDGLGVAISGGGPR